MNATTNAMVTGNDAVVGNHHRALPVDGFEVTTLIAVNEDAKVQPAPVNGTILKAFGMLFTAPFMGLVFVLALPFIGAYHLAKLALEAYANRSSASIGRVRKALALARNVGLFFAAPFVALGYVIALPVVGSFMVAKLALEARGKRAHATS